jgi:hypothetical protein
MPTHPKVDWKKLALESLTIVVSVLLAFWIDAWWNDRQRAIEEEVILASVYLEAKDLTTTIEEARKYVGAIRSSTLQLVNASVTRDDAITDDNIDQLFNAVLWHVDAEVFTNAPAIESLVIGGGIDSISNADLRHQIGTFMINLRGLRGDIRRESEYYNQTLIPFVQKHVLMAQLYSLESHWPGDPERTYPPYDIAALPSTVSHRGVLESRELQNILLHRVTTLTNILEWHRAEIEDQLASIIALTERELKIQAQTR